MIPDAVIDEIRDRVDVVAVIGRHMELKRSGRTWKGCCVYHGEKTPSFHVYPEDKHFHCYGCGANGDVFKFLQRLEGKEFPEVVRELAREAGIEIPEAEEESADQKRRRKDRNEILAACDAAARYWAARLSSRFGAEARRYLEERGITPESIGRFRVGVAADEWNDLAPRLKEKGIGFVMFHGGTPDADREDAIHRFRHDDEARVFLATDAASEGINLQHGASNLVHLDVPWNPNRYAQRNGRIDRHGQKADEVYGHGTHVAGIIAGTGKDSHGRYKGIAPGAAIIVAYLIRSGTETWRASRV